MTLTDAPNDRTNSDGLGPDAETPRPPHRRSLLKYAGAAAAGAVGSAVLHADPASATQSFTDEVLVTRTNQTDVAYAAQVSGESNPRWDVLANGTTAWADPSTGTAQLSLVPYFPSNSDPGRVLSFVGASNTSPIFQLVALQPGTSSVWPILEFYRTNGTPTSPGSVKNADQVLEIAAAGYVGAGGGFAGSGSASAGHWHAVATQDWSYSGGVNYVGLDWILDGAPTTGGTQNLAKFFGNGRVQHSYSVNNIGAYRFIVVNDHAGVTNATDVVIAAMGASGQTADLLQALTSAGAVVFKVDPAGKIGVGVASITSGATAEIGGDLYFTKEAARAIKVADSTTASANGAALSITAGKGNTASGNTIGGALTLAGGNAGIGNAVGGDATLLAGVAYGFAYGGKTNVRGGDGWAGGDVRVDGGGGFATGNLLIGTVNATKTGFGVSSPTAFAHLQAGTATANTAPLKVNSGTKLTTPEDGAGEFDGNWRLTKAHAIRFGVGGPIFDYFSDAGNSGTSETDLYSSTIPASTLANNGEKLIAEYGGTFVNSASTKKLKVYFGGTAILDTGALTTSATASWQIRTVIIRDSSTSVRCITTVTLTGTNTQIVTNYKSVGSLTLTNSQTLKITGTAAGTGAASNDIVASIGTITYDANA